MNGQPGSSNHPNDATAPANPSLSSSWTLEKKHSGALTGKTLGNYQLRELVGVGGMAEVYRAYDLLLQREVAVKVLARALANDASYVEQFRSEGRRIAALSHAHLVSVLHAGEDMVDGQRLLYLVMPLLQESLEDVLRREGKLPPAKVAQLLRQVAEGLEAAHAAGLIHRDVKPGNVLLDATGSPVLADFGIARDVRQPTTGASAAGQPRQRFGTPEYMAPELLLGASFDPRTDIYSLGVMLYELLTGRLPFDSEQAYARSAQTNAPPPTPPSVYEPSIPPALEHVTLTALAHNPDERYPNAATFARALSKAIPQQEPPALAETPPPPLPLERHADIGLHPTLPEWQIEQAKSARWHAPHGMHSRRRLLLIGTLAALTCIGGVLAMLQYQAGQQGHPGVTGRAGETGNSVNVVSTMTNSPGQTPLATSSGGSQTATPSSAATPSVAPGTTPASTATTAPHDALTLAPMPLVLGPAGSSTCSATQTITNNSQQTVGWSWEQPSGGAGTLSFRINNNESTVPWPSTTTYTSPGNSGTLVVIGDCNTQHGSFTVVVKDTLGSQYTFTMTLLGDN